MTQLYLISPPQIDLPIFRKELAAAFSAGRGSDELFSASQQAAATESNTQLNAQLIGAFQLRLKEADDFQIKQAIAELLPIARAYEVAFIINDRVDLCVDFRCDGVHLGQEDLEKTSIGKIRAMVGDNAAIGITCHASRHLAMEAGEAGADYVAFGAFYPTTSKPPEKLKKWGTPQPEILSWWQTYMILPCVAIGGITPANCKNLAVAGADFLAVISAIWNNPHGAAAAILEFEKELRS